MRRPRTLDESRRDAILAFIIQYKRAHDGASPTLKEIAAACELSSMPTVRYHLLKLAAAGRIELGVGATARSIRVPGGEWVYRGQP